MSALNENSSILARILPRKFFQDESTLWVIFSEKFKKINFSPRAYLHDEIMSFLLWMGVIVALLCGIKLMHYLRRPAVHMRCYPRFMFGHEVFGTRSQNEWMSQRSRLEAHELEARRK